MAALPVSAGVAPVKGDGCIFALAKLTEGCRQQLVEDCHFVELVVTSQVDPLLCGVSRVLVATSTKVGSGLRTEPAWIRSVRGLLEAVKGSP